MVDRFVAANAWRWTGALTPIELPARQEGTSFYTRIAWRGEDVLIRQALDPVRPLRNTHPALVLRLALPPSHPRRLFTLPGALIHVLETPHDTLLILRDASNQQPLLYAPDGTLLRTYTYDASAATAALRGPIVRLPGPPSGFQVRGEWMVAGGALHRLCTSELSLPLGAALRERIAREDLCALFSAADERLKAAIRVAISKEKQTLEVWDVASDTCSFVIQDPRADYPARWLVFGSHQVAVLVHLYSHLVLRRNAIWLRDDRDLQFIDLDQPTVLHTLAFPRHSLSDIACGVAFFKHEEDPTQAVIYSVEAGYAARVRLPADFSSLTSAQAHSNAFFFVSGDPEASIAAVILEAPQTPPPLPTLPDLDSLPRLCVRVLATVPRSLRYVISLLGRDRNFSALGGSDGSGSGVHGPLLMVGHRVWRIEA